VAALAHRRPHPARSLALGACELNHPGTAFGYRVRAQQGQTSVVYLSDHEHGSPRDQALEAFARGAGLVIWDSSYDDRHFAPYKGWGHSTWQEGMRFAGRCGVRQLALSHHDPSRDDACAAELQLMIEDPDVFLASMVWSWRSPARPRGGMNSDIFFGINMPKLLRLGALDLDRLGVAQAEKLAHIHPVEHLVTPLHMALGPVDQGVEPEDFVHLQGIEHQVQLTGADLQEDGHGRVILPQAASATGGCCMCRFSARR